jgi:acyl-CoA thioester hydrolase
MAQTRSATIAGMDATTLPSPTPLFTWPVRVYWEDTDAGGIVFYANYLKYFERARTEWLRALGISQSQLRADEGCIFVVSDVELKYLRSARLDDQLRVSAELVECGRSSFTLRQEACLMSPQGAADADTVLCRATVRIGCVNDQTHRPTRIPGMVQRALSGTVG